jgi:hypothetical protein
VARLNIEHFRKKLAEETDESKRQTIIHLVAEEENILAALQKSRRASAWANVLSFPVLAQGCRPWALQQVGGYLG